MPRRRIGSVTSTVSLLVGGLVAGLLLSEVAYRVTRRFVCVGGEYGTAAQARSWGWTHQPNAKGWAYACYQRGYEWSTDVTINSHGLREREIGYDKPPGVRRVLLLGDSMTEAVQVPPERTFGRLLEQSLAARGLSVQVINAGHAGFGTDNELLFYRDEGRKYEPDLVVQVFNFQNDVYENSPILLRRAYEQADVRWPPKPSFAIAADGSLQQAAAPPAAAVFQDHSLSGWIAARFFLVRSLQRLGRSAPAAPNLQFPVNYELYGPWDRTWEEAWALTKRLTQELRATVERDGKRFAVALLPSREMVAPAQFVAMLRALRRDPAAYDVERPRRLMTEFLQAEGIPFVDVSPALQAQAASAAPPFFVWDVHLTSAGHAAIAPVLTEYLRGRLDAP